jgi:hypothetical protein
MSLEAAQKSARTAAVAVQFFVGMTAALIVLGYGSKVVMAAYAWASPADTLGVVTLAAMALPAVFSVFALNGLSRVFAAFAKGDFFGRTFGRALTNACAWAMLATALQLALDVAPLDAIAQVAQHRMTYDPTKVTLLAFIVCAMFAGRIVEMAADLKEENEAIV